MDGANPDSVTLALAFYRTGVSHRSDGELVDSVLGGPRSVPPTKHMLSFLIMTFNGVGLQLFFIEKILTSPLIVVYCPFFHLYACMFFPILVFTVMIMYPHSIKKKLP
jgi:hypothetical protein